MSSHRPNWQLDTILLTNYQMLKSNFFTVIRTAEGDINEVLIKTLAEAHANTNLKLDVVHEMFRKPQVSIEKHILQFLVINHNWLEFLATVPAHSRSKDILRIMQYKSMGQGALWLDCAEKLTAMIQNIIEFAKLIPGFMRLSQDDQVSNRCSAARSSRHELNVSSVSSNCRFCSWKPVHSNWPLCVCLDWWISLKTLFYTVMYCCHKMPSIRHSVMKWNWWRAYLRLLKVSLSLN